MSPQRREIRSAYIEWAKLRSTARYNLAGKRRAAVSRSSDLHVRIEDLEITGSSGYGYQPLIERLAGQGRRAGRLCRSRAGHFDGESSGHGSAARTRMTKC